MTLLWPPGLLLLLALPIGLGVLRLLDGRRRRQVAAFTALGAAPAAAASRGDRLQLRRRIPSALFLVGFAILCVGLARPQGIVSVPREEGIVILAFDVSASMAATDLAPTRIAAAQAAAKDFVERQPASVDIGVVAFSDAGIAVQQPSNDQATVIAAIDRLAPQKGTSVGQGILASLHAIDMADAGPTVDFYSNLPSSPSPTPTPVPAGVHAPASIVLLTDGENNESPDPLIAAQTAAGRGVRIYTVGVGSAAGANLDLNGFQVHTQLDAATLQQIASVTGGTYYAAADTASLRAIYSELDTSIVVKPEEIELTALFGGAAIVILLAGALTSLVWLGRLP